jgi:TolA-binding protein
VQLTNAMEHGDLTIVEARFYLAKNLRFYDWEYERAGMVLEPLTKRYPQNPTFALMLGNINALLNRKEKAAACYHAVEAISKSMPASDPGLRDRAAALAREGLAALNAPPH